MIKLQPYEWKKHCLIVQSILREAKALLPSYTKFDEYLEHNELGLACSELIAIAWRANEQSDLFWDKINQASQLMQEPK